MYSFMYKYIRFVGLGGIGSENSDSDVFTPLGFLSQEFLVTQVSGDAPGLYTDIVSSDICPFSDINNIYIKQSCPSKILPSPYAVHIESAVSTECGLFS
jgi:hypothetical protein